VSLILTLYAFINILWWINLQHTALFRFEADLRHRLFWLVRCCNFENLSQIISWTEIRVLTGQLQKNIHLVVLRQFPCKFESAFRIFLRLKLALIPAI